MELVALVGAVGAVEGSRMRPEVLPDRSFVAAAHRYSHTALKH